MTLFLCEDVTMTTLNFLKSCALMMAVGTLSGCGGGGAAVVDAPTFGDMDSTASSPLVAVVLNASAGTVTADQGRLDRRDNKGTIGGLSGELSADRSEIDLKNGAITLDGEAGAYSARFALEAGPLNTLGIVGIATAASALPSGTATYSGDTILTATSGSAIYELNGTADVVAGFGSGTPSVTTTLSDLSGTMQGSSLDIATDVADVGTLVLAGSAISGAAFNGGTAELTSDVLALSGSEKVVLRGAFFGPDAGEVGGAFIIKDGTTQIFGDFLAD
jgi:hypothetical protein